MWPFTKSSAQPCDTDDADARIHTALESAGRKQFASIELTKRGDKKADSKHKADDRGISGKDRFCHDA